MKICCLIDSLGAGGAQRQMTWLVKALVGKGHDVRLVTYFDGFSHFLPDILESGVEPECVYSASKPGRFIAIRKAIRRCRPDCIVSFLNTPNLLAVFASIQPDRIPVVVSERSLQWGKPSVATRLRFQAFRLADRVITNSIAQREFLVQHYPFLSKKTKTIVNCVDLVKFNPSKAPSSGGVSLLVAASVRPVKNTHRLVEAVSIANQSLDEPIRVDWFGENLFVDGKPTPGSNYYLEALDLVLRHGIGNSFFFHNTVSDLHSRYKNYDALCLASLYEGCPNVVCEAMASGLPVLASDISDLRMMLDAPAKLFDPCDVGSIARALVNFSHTSISDRQQCGTRNRKYAETHLSPEHFASEFDRVLTDVVGNSTDLADSAPST